MGLLSPSEIARKVKNELTGGRRLELQLPDCVD